MSELSNEVPVTEETVSSETPVAAVQQKYADGPNTISHFAKSLGFVPEAIEKLLIEKKFQFSRQEKLGYGAFKMIKDNLEIISKNDKEIRTEIHKAAVAAEKERKKQETKEKKEKAKAEGKKPAKAKAKKGEVIEDVVSEETVSETL